MLQRFACRPAQSYYYSWPGEALPWDVWSYFIFFLLSLPAWIIDYWWQKKKKNVTHFPKDLTPQAYSQMSMKESLLSVGHLDTVSHQRNVEVFVETVSSPEWPSSLLIGPLCWFGLLALINASGILWVVRTKQHGEYSHFFLSICAFHLLLCS